MTKTLGIAAGVLAVLVAGSGLAVAARHHERPDGPGFFARRIAAELDLTDQQKGEIRDILHDGWQNGMGDAVDDVRLARRDLRHAIQDPEATDSAISAASAKVAQAETTLALARHRTAKKVIAVLDDEQRAKARELRDELEARGDALFERIGARLGTGDF